MTHPGPLVVKIGGSAIDDSARAGPLWRAIAEAHRASEGRLVLVHGGGGAVDRLLDRLGLAVQRRDGIRITPEDQIEHIAGVLAGRVNKSIVGELLAEGLSPVGLCLSDGRSAECGVLEGAGFDPGRVGRITGGDPGLVEMLLGAGFLPVLCSIGMDEAGRLLNINADDAAAGIAAIVRARGLVLLTDVAGVVDQEGRLIGSLDAAAIEALIVSGVIAGGMIPKVRAALAAAETCNAPATIASFDDAGALVALARGGTAGTRIVPVERQGAPARAARASSGA